MKAHTDNPIAPPSVSLRSRLHDFVVVAGGILLLLLSARSTTFAGSATWNLNPGSGGGNAGEGTVVNMGGVVSRGPGGGTFFFYNGTSAGNAQIDNHAGVVSGARGGLTSFSLFGP